MKTLQIAFVALVLAASSAAAKDSNTPSYDDCHSKSLHGIWDCR